MLPYAEDDMSLKWIFQHENDPDHTALSVNPWISTKNLNVLDWQGQFPDIKRTKNLRNDVGHIINQFTDENLDQLWLKVLRVWSATPEEPL